VDYKWFTKIHTMGLTPLVDKLITRNQTNFSPGEGILEEFILLYEVLQELRVKRKEGGNLESGI